MGKKEKLIARIAARPVDFTFDELVTLLGYLGYSITASGKTGGSRVTFANEKNDYIRLHKPHPRKILKRYQVEDVLDILIRKGLI